MLIDEVFPEWDHQLIVRVGVLHNVEATLAVVQEVTFGEAPVAWLLVALHELPARVLRGRRLPRRKATVWDWYEAHGFLVVAARPDQIVTIGAARYESLLADPHPVTSVEALADMAEPGHSRAAADFRAIPSGDGVLLESEIRVLAVDGEARKRFGRYWLWARPLAILMRRSWLKAVARRIT